MHYNTTRSFMTYHFKQEENMKVTFLLCVLLIAFTVACTYSITMVHSEGGSDVIDENQVPSNDMTIPVLPVKP